MRQGSQQGGFACIGKPVKITQAYQTCKKMFDVCVSEIHRKTITQGGSQRMTQQFRFQDASLSAFYDKTSQSIKFLQTIQI